MEHDHHGHDHHGGHPATSISELHHPGHGSYEGHVVPGLMFIIWSAYWLWSIIDIHLRTRAAGLHAYLPILNSGATSATARPHSSSSNKASSSSSRQQSNGRDEPFRNRSWYPWPYWPAPHLEPIFKVLLSLVGVLIELYIGFRGWRPLYKEDGHFAEFHANNWQHALMYGGVAVSGMVDLIGHYTPLPAGTEQGFLSIAFLVETLLMGMHTKHNALDQLVHLLLTWIMIACVVVTAAGIAAPHSLLLALLRGMVVFFQGTWFWHVGAIMFKDNMAWDMEDMGAVQFVPVVFCLHMVLICLGTFSVYLFMRWMYAKLGITAPAAGGLNHLYHVVPQTSKYTPGQLHHHSSDVADTDAVLDSQLEMSDYPLGHLSTPALAGTSDTRARDAARSKGSHAY